MSFGGIGDRISTGVGRRVGRWQDSARQARAGINAPKPPVRVETHRAAPGWAYRIGCLVLGVLTIIAFAPGVVLIVILSALLALVLARPAAGTAGLYCGVLGLFWMIEPSAPNSLAQIAVLALAPALWVLAGVIADLPLRARIEIAVLRAPAIRYLVVDVVAQLALIGAQLLHSHQQGIGTGFAGVLVLVVAVIMAVAAWLLFPRLRGESD